MEVIRRWREVQGAEMGTKSEDSGLRAQTLAGGFSQLHHCHRPGAAVLVCRQGCAARLLCYRTRRLEVGPPTPGTGECAWGWRQQSGHDPNSSRCLPHGWDPISLLPPTRPPHPTSGPFSLPRHLWRRQEAPASEVKPADAHGLLAQPAHSCELQSCSGCLHSFTHTPSGGSAHPQLVQRQAPTGSTNRLEHNKCSEAGNTEAPWTRDERKRDEE